jgi:hypothetical protein
MRSLPRKPNLAWFGLILLVLFLYPLHGHFAERENRRELAAHGKEATALVERSSGLETVILAWIDQNGETRTGEARTRKQGSGRRIVGERVRIRYVDDRAAMPVILSEEAEREWANEFGLFWNPLITVILVGAMIAGVAWVGSRA